ncbi:hypothetical protein [Kitasatospora sp. NPDC050463]|uniref:hypothetical protein n=1 Tax=Kitasatospora sp. NPDC050463 TaxID=3155786 RepID=UPI0033C2E7C4
MSEQDRFEDDLLYAITRTGEGFHTEQAPLVAGGLDRGRRRWRRRSAAAVVGGAAALALVGTGAVYFSGPSPAGTALAAAGPGSGSGAGAGSGTAGGSASPVASASPSAPAAVITGDEVLATLQALLPAGRTTGGSGRGTEPSGKPGGAPLVTANLVLDDGKGQAAVGISVSRIPEGDPGLAENTCPDKKYVPYDACTATTLPDGGSLTVFQGYEYPDRRVDTKWWNAKLVGKDGRLIELSEWNAAAEKDSPVTRATPPLGAEQLKAVVTDRSWDRIVAAIPVPAPVKPRKTGKEYSQEEILAIAAKLLPAGLTETETGGEEGFADFVVNDGKGKSLVEINVQDRSGDAERGSDFAGAQQLPDGTKVVSRKTPGNPVMWTVDTLRPDGLRVVISAFNSGSQRTPATRTAPALTMDQLKAIATGPAWKLKK